METTKEHNKNIFWENFLGDTNFGTYRANLLLDYKLLMSDTAPLRIRKCLSSMKDQSPVDINPPIFVPNGERKAYFYCLKMLGILPPPPGSGFENWNYFSPATKWIPK